MYVLCTRNVLVLLNDELQCAMSDHWVRSLRSVVGRVQWLVSLTGVRCSDPVPLVRLGGAGLLCVRLVGLRPALAGAGAVLGAAGRC